MVNVKAALPHFYGQRFLLKYMCIVFCEQYKSKNWIKISALITEFDCLAAIRII